MVIAVLIVVNVPIYFLLGKLFFDDWDGFWDAAKYWIKPDIISWFDGEWFEDWWAELKLGAFLACCAAIVYGEYWLVSRFFLSSS